MSRPLLLSLLTLCCKYSKLTHQTCLRRDRRSTHFSPFSRPYAMAAAVGSLIMRKTFNPANVPASLVALRWKSLKYAGNVMTAFFTVAFKYDSAIILIMPRTMALTFSLVDLLISSLYVISIFIAPFTLMILIGHFCMSFWTRGSSNFRPINRFTSNTKFAEICRYLLFCCVAD